MIKYLVGVFLWMALLVNAYAEMVPNCTLTEFRWLCQIPIRPKPSHRTPSVIDCGGTTVFVTPAQYLKIMRYQRANVNMTLRVNEEYITSPCIPAQW